MKKVFFCISLTIIILPLFSKTINLEQLSRLAEFAYAQRSGLSEVKIKSIDYITQESDTLIAIYHIDNHGYIVMSTEDAATPVLAYSLDKDVDLNNPAPAFLYWINLYKSQIQEIKRRHLTADSWTLKEWEALIQGQNIGQKAEVVKPLTTSMWNQNQYYNYYSPEDAASPAGYDGKCPNGCVALAMGMLLYYHRFPESGTGSSGNNTEYGYYSVNHTQQHYNYEAMSDELIFYNNEVAKLIFHCAISVQMSYAPEGSGASTSDAADALVDHFKFSSSTRYMTRSYTNINTFINTLKSNLDDKLPILYSGYTEDWAGHAFLCDGYDSDNLFHFNFGWGGYGNGYFVAGNINSGVDGYYQNQAVIVNAVPRTEPDFCTGEKIIQSVTGSLEDGSRNENYVNNSDCTFIIAPNDAKSFSVTIVQMETEENIDTLSFWKGDPSQGELQGSYSGNIENYSFIVNTDSLYITFKSNGSVTGAGWKLIYSATENEKNCKYYTVRTEATGEISDGSAEDDIYDANTECKWVIRSPGANYITLSFLYFDLSPEDFLQIYVKEGSAFVLKDEYTGSSIPEWKEYHTSQIMVNFVSDNYLQRDGFLMRWSVNTGISEENRTNAFRIYPNPTEGELIIQLKDAEINGEYGEIYDLYGRMVKSFNINSKETILNFSDFSSGIYAVKVVQGASITVKKFIKL